MTPFLILTIYICSACGVGSVVMIFGSIATDRADKMHKKLITPKYIEIISHIMNQQEGLNVRLPKVSERRARMSLITILSKVADSYYSYNKRAIQKLIDVYSLDTELIKRTQRAVGTRRALYIQLASKLPLPEPEHQHFGKYIRHSNRMVRLSALLHDISVQPEMVNQILNSHPYQLTDTELRHVVNTVIGSRLPPPLMTELLESKNRNLQFVGLELAQLYQRPELISEIIAILDRKDYTILRKVLRTLIKLHTDIANNTIAEAITSLKTHQRKSIYRLCIGEGYSQHSFNTIYGYEGDVRLKRYITDTISSHKKSLATTNITAI